MAIPMAPYLHHVTGNPRPASTYRGARRNAARSCKAQALKQFRAYISGWPRWVHDYLPWLTLTARPIVDRWRTLHPAAYDKAWVNFLANELETPPAHAA
jgi:hypothetical protein